MEKGGQNYNMTPSSDFLVPHNNGFSRHGAVLQGIGDSILVLMAVGDLAVFLEAIC